MNKYCVCGCGNKPVDPCRDYCRGHNLRVNPLRLEGADHHCWKGSSAGRNAGMMRARNKYELGRCELCEGEAVDRHHKDGNTLNNEKSNVLCLCRKCHMEVDGRLEGFKGNRYMETKPPQPCVICGELKKPLRKGRCHNCDIYYRKHGIERSVYLSRLMGAGTWGT